jgi:hypothetical protein
MTIYEHGKRPTPEHRLNPAKYARLEEAMHLNDWPTSSLAWMWAAWCVAVVRVIR